MSDTVISIENLSKRYRLGVINSGTFHDDLKIWLARASGKPNPLSRIGEVDYGNRDNDYVWALRDVNFTVQRGEALGIIGRNGAGKSTLLKILSRVTSPTEGHVRVKGRIASLLEVGTGFHPELTGRENIYLNGAIMGMSKAEVNRKLDEIIDFSGVEKYIDTPVKRYSSGMYVRLAFAVAAHLEPEILVVDEVLAVGDAEFQKKCLGKMGEVTGEGRTVLFVSHNMSAIQRICPQTIFLKAGEIKDSGETTEVVNKYLESLATETYYWKRQKESTEKIAFFDSIAVVDQNLQQKNCINSSDSLRLLLEFKLKKDITDLHLGVALLSDSMEQIIGTAPQDYDIDPPSKIGEYKYLLELPQDILMPRDYLIKVMLWTQKDGMIDVIDNIKFHVTETLSLANKIHGGRQGLLAIKCKWEALDNMQHIE